MSSRSEKKQDSAKPRSPHADRLEAYLDLGRTNQKRRTRDVLINIAADLIRSGKPISVTDVADAAGVSRTTAYRYFPTSEMLGAQATLVAADSLEAKHLTEFVLGPGSPMEKLQSVIKGSHEMTIAHEAAYRSLVHFTVELETGDVSHRPTFRRKWLEDALGSLKKDLGPARFNQLTAALCLLCGIESMIVLNDICRLSSGEALKVKSWVGQRILRAAIEDAAEYRANAAARPVTDRELKSGKQRAAK
jgi:AcrR family transcriptional regulator